MGQLFGRRIELSIDDLKVDPGHHIKFKATKTYRPSPNSCEVRIDNLSPEQRARITKSKTPLVRLAAGYGDGSAGVTQLFYGNVIFSKHEIDGDSGDVITTLSTTDGGDEMQKKRIHVTFGKGTTTGVVLRRIVDALGLSPGNTAKIAQEILAGAKASLYIEGATLSGSAANELNHICRSCGYDWSVQDKTVAIRKLGKSADNFAIVFTPDTGLIGSPSVSNKGVVSGKCLIFKAGEGLDLTPGRLIQVTTEFVKGQFIMAKTEFEGDNYEQDWYCDFEAVTKRADLGTVK